MVKWLVVFLVALALMVVAVNADIKISQVSLVNDVFPGETATFKLTITNDKSTDNAFIVDVDPLKVYPFNDIFKEIRISTNQVDVPAFSEGSFTVEVKVLEDVVPNKNYETAIKIRSLVTKEKIVYSLGVSVVEPENLIDIATDIPNKISPGEEVSFNVNLKNRANLILPNAEIYINSDLFSESFKEKFYPFYETTKTITFRTDPAAKPGMYTLGVRVYSDGLLKGKLIKGFEVVSNQDVVEKTRTSSGFLTKTKVITKTNVGNTAVQDRLKFSISSFTKLFTRFDKEPGKAEGMLEWQFLLQPGESYSVTITTDYRILFAVIAAIVIIVGAYIYRSTKGVIIKKSILKVREVDGTSELKVMLHLKNKTDSRIRNVKLVETLPSIVSHSPEFGTLKPDKIQKEEKMTRMIWSVEELEKGEERIISYNVKTRLHVIGKLVLPPVQVRYKHKTKMEVVRSNKLVFHSRA